MRWKSGFDPLQELKISLFSVAHRLALATHKTRNDPNIRKILVPLVLLGLMFHGEELMDRHPAPRLENDSLHSACVYSLNGRIIKQVHYRVNNSPPLVPVLSWINPVHVLPAHYLRSVFISYSHLLLGLPGYLFPSGFPNKIPYAFLFSPVLATPPSPPKHYRHP